MTTASGSDIPPEPPADCALCPRLVAFRRENRHRAPDWFNAPVPSFGDPKARLLIVGLAPGLKGANRTGRPFTGDYAGDLLYATLKAFGFAQGLYHGHADDGLRLVDCMITNAVRCVPPNNKPTAAEIAACRPFLLARIESLARLRVILALGRIAHDSVISGFGLRRAAHPFGHGHTHHLGKGLQLFDSYHCSRYNTNTGRLSRQMFEDIFAAISQHLKDA
ncbi:MAG: uracil-DNA glycosylase [Alphaproteobacteria bacterium]|nr:MAG: uracil-DNA glycosylase [Alphaproteobacteria bacterium]